MSVPQRDDQDGPWNPGPPPGPPHGPPSGPPPSPPRAPVFNAMPPAVVLIALGIVGVSVLGQLLPGFQRWTFNAGVFIAAERGTALPDQPLGPFAPYLLHVFIHASLLHIATNLAILVATGRAVGEQLGSGLKGSLGFVLLFFACAITGSGLEMLMHQGPPTPMVGASTAVSGLIAAAGWVRGGWRGMAQLALPWIGINLIFGLLGDMMPIPIAWVGHIGGTVGGIILTPFVLAVFSERAP
jgi:membrane associated rhomboid family serine protease